VSVYIFRRNQQQAIDFQGTGLCITYREHVMALADRGMSAEQIRELLGQEEGQTMTEQEIRELKDREGVELADGSLHIEYGCARIDEILERVPRRPPATGG
jgi:hypothetical protein